MKCKACLAKDDEIKFLRSLVKDLNDRLMSFDGSAAANYQAMTSEESPIVQDVNFIEDFNSIHGEGLRLDKDAEPA